MVLEEAVNQFSFAGGWLNVKFVAELLKNFALFCIRKFFQLPQYLGRAHCFNLFRWRVRASAYSTSGGMTTILQSPYREAASADLAVVGLYRDTGREVRLHSDAAAALVSLLADARGTGVRIIPISGFRSIEYQAGLYQKAIVKYGSEEVARGWVARPGFSEHHTGLAIDLGDCESPACDVATPFEETAAFRWLQKNADRFGFEMSYPRNNATGINYEPWHWRFVGTSAAKQIFEQ